MDLSQLHLGLSLRQLRLLLAVALVLAATATWAFVLRGADAPADPVLGAPVDAAGNPAPPGGTASSRSG